MSKQWMLYEKDIGPFRYGRDSRKVFFLIRFKKGYSLSFSMNCGY